MKIPSAKKKRLKSEVGMATGPVFRQHATIIVMYYVSSSGNGDPSTIWSSTSPGFTPSHGGRLSDGVDGTTQSHLASAALPQRRVWPRCPVLLRWLLSRGVSDARRPSRVVPAAVHARTRSSARAASHAYCRQHGNVTSSARTVNPRRISSNFANAFHAKKHIENAVSL